MGDGVLIGTLCFSVMIHRRAVFLSTVRHGGIQWKPIKTNNIPTFPAYSMPVIEMQALLAVTNFANRKERGSSILRFVRSIRW